MREFITNPFYLYNKPKIFLRYNYVLFNVRLFDWIKDPR